MYIPINNPVAIDDTSIEAVNINFSYFLNKLYKISIVCHFKLKLTERQTLPIL